MYIYTCVYISVYIHTDIYLYTHTHLYIYTYIEREREISSILLGIDIYPCQVQSSQVNLL